VSKGQIVSVSAAESLPLLVETAQRASRTLAESVAELAACRACEQLRLAIENYQRAGYGSHVTQPLRDALVNVEFSVCEARSS
jgi:hypothetical protein